MSKEELDAFFARLDVARAETEAVVDSWLIKAGHTIPPKKSQAQIDAEDAALFREGPPNLGLGAPIPSWWIVSEAQQNNNKSLRAKFFPTKGLKASKARDTEEKAASAKRGLTVESSDEEEGRSGLGRAKKLKIGKRSEPADAVLKSDQSGTLPSITSTVNIKASKPKAMAGSIETPIQAHPISAQAPAQNIAAHHGKTTSSVLGGYVADVEIVSEQSKKDRKRAKEERRKAKQESFDHMKLDVELEDNREHRVLKRASEESRESKQELIDHHMDFDAESESKMSKQERKDLKRLKNLGKKSEEREAEHLKKLAEKDAAAIAGAPDKKGQVTLKKPNLNRNDEMERDVKDKSASDGLAKVNAQTTSGTLSKDQKNREKKQRKREKKRRATEAAKSKSS